MRGLPTHSSTSCATSASGSERASGYRARPMSGGGTALLAPAANVGRASEACGARGGHRRRRAQAPATACVGETPGAWQRQSLALDDEHSLSSSKCCWGKAGSESRSKVRSRIQPEPRQILAPCGTPYRTRAEIRNRAYFHARDSRSTRKAGSNVGAVQDGLEIALRGVTLAARRLLCQRRSCTSLSVRRPSSSSAICGILSEMPSPSSCAQPATRDGRR